MKSRLKVAIIVAAVGLIAVICVLSARMVGYNSQVSQVSLTFQRYSDFVDPYVRDVAFLWLTNASNESFLLTMTGNSNTMVADSGFGRFRMTWMVNCEFRDPKRKNCSTP